MLHNLTRQGRTIICTIHQPTASEFSMFDQVSNSDNKLLNNTGNIQLRRKKGKNGNYKIIKYYILDLSNSYFIQQNL